MCRRILLLSGPIGSGKSSVARVLNDCYQYRSISSGGYLRSIALDHSREALQDAGDRLDRDTDYRWLIDQVAAPTIAAVPSQHYWLLDAVRKTRQIEHFRELFGISVWHVHLHAPEDVLSERVNNRTASLAGDYQTAIRHPNEVAARDLGRVADHVYDSSLLTTQQIAESIHQTLEGE